MVGRMYGPSQTSPQEAALKQMSTCDVKGSLLAAVGATWFWKLCDKLC